MSYMIKKGATSNIILVFIQDSSQTNGAGLTGLTSGSSGLVCYRARSDDGNAGATQITLSGGTRGTWSSGGFVEKDSTNMPGWYELGLPNAAVVTGSNYCGIELKGATNMAPCPNLVQLTDFDPQDSVHLGLTCLPNVASGSAGAIPTTGTGANQIAVDGSGNASTNLVNIAGSAVSTTTAQIGVNAVKLGNTVQTGRDIGASVLLSAGTGAGQLNFTSGVVNASLVQILGTALTETTGQIAAAFKQFFNIASPTSTMNTITTVTTTTNLTTYTGNTPQTGDAYARLGAPAGASTSADIAALKTDLDGGVALTTSERNSVADAILDRNMATGTDSGTTTIRTVRQALRFLRNKWAISAGTLTVYKEDDTTSSWTGTVTTDGTAQPIVSTDPSG